MTHPTHFVDHDTATVSPLCGDSTHAKDWTTVPAQVTCVECVERLASGARREAVKRGAAPAPARAPRS